jgi:hypothetical protein
MTSVSTVYCEWHFTNFTFMSLSEENITGKENFYMDLLLSMQAFMRLTNGGLGLRTWVCFLFIIKCNLLTI